MKSARVRAFDVGVMLGFAEYGPAWSLRRFYCSLNLSTATASHLDAKSQQRCALILMRLVHQRFRQL